MAEVSAPAPGSTDQVRDPAMGPEFVAPISPAEAAAAPPEVAGSSDKVVADLPAGPRPGVVGYVDHRGGSTTVNIERDGGLEGYTHAARPDGPKTAAELYGIEQRPTPEPKGHWWSRVFRKKR